MRRQIENDFIRWKEDPSRVPLLVRGARQVGKSFVIEQFGRSHFKNMVVINFEYQTEYKDCFQDLDPNVILSQLEVMANATIVPGETLLFLDEIQECPRAILALRYFKEKLPLMHVIGAASLLEFVLRAPDFRMPVGRIQYYYMQPLSFKEYLHAVGENKAVDFIEHVELKTDIPDAIHKKLLQHVRHYFILGGMPAVVDEYRQHNSFQRCQSIQSRILTTYQDDFGKYSRGAGYQYMQQLFKKAPELIAQHFKYVKVAKDVPSRDIKLALNNLVNAGLVHLVYATKATGLPLNALLNEKKFKLLFLDVGLVQRATQLSAETLLKEDLHLINKGAFAEQFVGQELLAAVDCRNLRELYYWERAQRTSTAELDYIINIDQKIIPVEVKSGSTGRLKSLQIFMEENAVLMGLRISQKILLIEKNIISIPFYLCSEINRLLK